ncbi:hypothetical protein CSUI_001370 [Cystoisospora suis]|uniref:DnaK family protein n=1 Tax=Cystoisospora suis TaxID=483139 RepID=A0A2C6KL63_9APIC|nr:hypothetical protein CSUI_001370 [Cystoisospora suis]
MAVLGIDLGSLNSVMATVQRGTVSVVTTELSDRVTPSLVGFTEDQRLMGDHALAQMKSNAKNTCRYFKNILGVVHDPSDSSLQKEVGMSLQNMAPLSPNGLMGYQVQYRGKEMKFSAERVTAAFLTKLRQVAEGSLQKAISEIVIACPSWFRDSHRTALLNASQIAGLKCLRIISDMAATCLDYGMYRRQHFSPDHPHIAAFVNVGHSTSSCCIAAFWSDRLRILAEVSDNELGGRDMDYEIMKHFASEFEKKTQTNPLATLKARLKLEDQANKAKKILSANLETGFHVECLVEDQDCSGLLTRDVFEDLCSQTLAPKLQKLLQSALEKSGLKSKEEVASVEIAGGCTRIPWVQRCISSVFGLDLSRTLAGDETVARGCALQAAMASASFRVKEFGFGERLQYPICITWDGERVEDRPSAVQTLTGQGHYIIPEAEGGGLQTLSSSSGSSCCYMIPPGAETDTIRKFTFLRSSSFTVKASYADLPPGSPQAQLDTCQISLTNKSSSSGDLPQEVQVYVHLNYYGLLRFVRVCVKEKREELVPQEQGDASMKPEVPSSQQEGSTTSSTTAQDSSSTSSSSATGMEEKHEHPSSEPCHHPSQGKSSQSDGGDTSVDAVMTDASSSSSSSSSRVVVKKIDVPYQIQEAACRTTGIELRDYREQELNMENDDRVAREKLDKLNELETYLYQFRDHLTGKWRDFASDAERKAGEKQLGEVQTWIDDVLYDVSSVSKSAVVSKLQGLHDIGDKIQRRYEDHEGRREAEQHLHACISESRLLAQSNDEEYAHVPVEERRKVHDLANQTEAWLSEMVAKQRDLPLYVDPVVTVRDMQRRREDLQYLVHQVFSQRHHKSSSKHSPAGDGNRGGSSPNANPSQEGTKNPSGGAAGEEIEEKANMSGSQQNPQASPSSSSGGSDGVNDHHNNTSGSGQEYSN